MNDFTQRLHKLSTAELSQFRSIMINTGLVFALTGKFRAHLKEELKNTSERLHAVLSTVMGGSAANLDIIITEILGER